VPPNTIKKPKLKKLLAESILDNGPYLIGKVMFETSQKTGVILRFIDLGKPKQNAKLESFNGKFRDECLNEHCFFNINIKT